MATKTRRLADLLANIDDNSKVTSAGLLDATITADDLADDSVGTAELIDDSVTAAAIADDAVGSAAIADAAVDTARLAASAVTSAKMAASAVSVKPHIELGVLQPAVAGKDLDGVAVNTSHGSTYTYGTTHADGHKYYYTDIKGSKPIKDPRIGGHFGSQRHTFSSAQLLEQETATHGQNVLSIDGREWCRMTTELTPNYYYNSHGMRLNVSNNASTTRFMEVTGYFSDVSFISFMAANRGVKWTLDGGSESSEIASASVNPLQSRFVNCGSVVKLGVNATLGIHTIKIRANGSDGLYPTGIELIAQDTGSTARKNHVNIPAQNVVSYGKKFSVGSDTLTNAVHKHYNPFAFKTDGTTAWASGANNGTSFPVGTGSSHNIDTATSLGLENWKSGTDYYKPYNGGRVVRWVDSSGVIKTSVTVMPPNAKSVGDADITKKANAAVANDTYLPTFELHTTDIHENKLSETSGNFWAREFGNGAANTGGGGYWADASMVAHDTEDQIGFIMDDGLTGLTGALSGAGTDQGRGVYNASQDSSHFITFIGSGVVGKFDNTSDATRTNTWVDVAQDLPYGTHVIEFERDTYPASKIHVDGVQVTSGTTPYTNFREVTFHQPKMPPIPEDACILADYMLMAEYKPRTATGANKISKGVRLLSASRDMYCTASSGTMTLNQPNVAQAPTGFEVYHSTTPSASVHKISCPAFATHCNLVGYGDRRQLFVDGTTRADTTSGTANNAYNTQDVALELGTYTFGSYNLASTNGNLAHMEIATPIHTSHHYQSFESPFLKELVGGDRSMEQTNLIVTPDGKSWDEVTRDTSYIGNIVVKTNNASQQSAGAHEGVGTEFRGFEDGKYLFFKDFALAQDRVICLKDGHYHITAGGHRNADMDGAHYWQIKVNGTGIATKYLMDENHGHVTAAIDFVCKRGDYIQIRGIKFTDSNWTFSISRIV